MRRVRDTIYRTARTLQRALAGKPMTRFHSEYAQLVSANDEAPFAGQTVTHIEARGKWLLDLISQPVRSSPPTCS